MAFAIPSILEKPGEQRYKDHADYSYTSAGHELLHALAFY